MTAASTADVLDFEIPAERIATVPGERRGVPRQQTPMLVCGPHGVRHRRAEHLAHVLSPGDLLVVNTSMTRPAALHGTVIGSGEAAAVHLSTPLPPARDRAGLLDGEAAWNGRRWVVEVRRLHHDRTAPWLDLEPGTRIRIDGPREPATVRLLAPVAAGPDGVGVRLWQAEIDSRLDVTALQQRHGLAISYDRPRDPWPLEDRQTVFARRWGSAEMPSAGRPFTPVLVTDLIRHGIGLAPVVLHAGVSSGESSERPQAEPMEVPAATAAQVNAARSAGGRVVAVGTSVVRALETVADRDGVVHPGTGWTDLVLSTQRPARVVDGLLTGWHEAEASHLDLLLAVAGHERVATAYRAGLAGEYLWHELGDVCLLLP